MPYLPEQATPFDNRAVDVAGAEQVSHPAVFVQRIFVHGRDNLLRAGTVFGRQTVFEIAGNALQSIPIVTRDGQTSAPAIVLAAEAKARVKIRQVINEFIERIFLVFERSGDGESVTLLEETHESSTHRRHARGIHESEPAPEQSGARAGRQFLANWNERADRAIGGQDFAFLRPPQRDAVLVHRNAHCEFAETDVRKDFMAVRDEADDTSFLLCELLFNERNDLLLPQFERRLASVPVGQSANPFSDQDAIVIELLGDGDGASVGFALVGFGQNNERARPNSFQGGGLSENGT